MKEVEAQLVYHDSYGGSPRLLGRSSLFLRLFYSIYSGLTIFLFCSCPWSDGFADSPHRNLKRGDGFVYILSMLVGLSLPKLPLYYFSP
jgi:hypothetical protein